VDPLPPPGDVASPVPQADPPERSLAEAPALLDEQAHLDEHGHSREIIEHAIDSATAWAVDHAAWAEEWAARPLLRGWLHVGAVGVAIPVGIAVARRAPTRETRIACGVWVAGISTMFATSATYHRASRGRRSEKWLRRADHAAIFGAVAGTWTPIAVAALPPPAAAAALVGVWGAAAAGAITKFVRLDESRSAGSWAYPTLGWAAVGLAPFVWQRAGWKAIASMTAGGLAYTIGAIVFTRQKPDPAPGVFGYHEVWHTATLIGAACHAHTVATVVAGHGQTATGKPRSRRSLRRR